MGYGFGIGILIKSPVSRPQAEGISEFALMYNGELITYTSEELTYGA